MGKEAPFNCKLNIIFEYHPIKNYSRNIPFFYNEGVKKQIQIIIDLKQHMEILLGEPNLLINLKHNYEFKIIIYLKGERKSFKFT